MGRHISLLKADVEGFEPGVVASAKHMLKAGNISNIIMEYSPHVYEKNDRWVYVVYCYC